ncbi:MAG: hypothetical protein AB1Z98_16390 [Nannocystaceae bacterium]
MSGLDARRVWDVWRSLLVSDPWRAALRAGPEAVEPLLRGLSSEDRAVVEAYAQTPEATRIMMTMFRRRTVTVARSSLSLVAPMSKSLLDQTGSARCDELALAYTRHRKYADDGPNFCRSALGFIELLRDQPEFRDRPGWSDVLALDAARLRLMMRLGLDDSWERSCHDDEGFDPDAVESFDDLEGWLVQACANHERARTEHDVTAWLEAPRTALGRVPLDPGPCHWAVSLLDAEDDVEYAQLSIDAMRALDALPTPTTPRRLATVLPALSEDEVLAVLADLLDERLIRFMRAP